MAKAGNEGGREIAAIAAKLHKNAILIIPLYRSCIVILPPKRELKERGAVEMKMYHDPCWMGGDRTIQELPNFCETLKFYGQRSGPTIVQDGEELGTFSRYERSFSFLPRDLLVGEAFKERKYSESGGSYQMVDRPWARKLDPVVKAELHQLGYDISPPVEWIPPPPSFKLRRPKKEKNGK